MIAQGILILAEHDNQQLKTSTLRTLSAASHLPGEITILIAGNSCQKVAEKAARLDKVRRVWVVDDQIYANSLAENIANLVAELGKSFSYILAPATIYGKNILPRVAALLGVAQISEIIQVISEDTFIRPIYAGNALETVQSIDPIKVLTIRPTAFQTMQSSRSESALIETISYSTDLKLSSFVTRTTHDFSKGPELSNARVVVAGGRGLQKAENFKLLEAIADKLGAAIGATRAAVDEGFVPNDYQIGQTGKVVAPELYIAVGISGAVQHLAGMKESKIIVAINKDPDAPIFEIADYGLIGDLFEVLPELNQELATLKN